MDLLGEGESLRFVVHTRIGSLCHAPTWAKWKPAHTISAWLRHPFFSPDPDGRSDHTLPLPVTWNRPYTVDPPRFRSRSKTLKHRPIFCSRLSIHLSERLLARFGNIAPLGQKLFGTYTAQNKPCGSSCAGNMIRTIIMNSILPPSCLICSIPSYPYAE